MNFHERMTMNRCQQLWVLNRMAAHDAVVGSAQPRVDAHMSSAVARNAENRRRLEKTTASDEPLTLHRTMSHNALHQWRLTLAAHERRKNDAKPSLERRLPPSALAFRKRRSRRRRDALRSVPPPPRRKATTDPFALIMRLPVGTTNDDRLVV